MDLWLQFLITALGANGLGAFLGWLITKRRSDHDIFVDNFSKIIAQKDAMIDDQKKRFEDSLARLAEEISGIREKWSRDIARADKLMTMTATLKEQLADQGIELLRFKEFHKGDGDV